jgi:hypothetical protein
MVDNLKRQSHSPLGGLLCEATMRSTGKRLQLAGLHNSRQSGIGNCRKPVSEKPNSVATLKMLQRDRNKGKTGCVEHSVRNHCGPNGLMHNHDNS